mgnify:CR=1 FL=1
MQIEINTKVRKVWSWKKFRFIEERSFEVVKYKRKREWIEEGNFIYVERKTILKVFNNYMDAFEYQLKLESYVK